MMCSKKSVSSTGIKYKVIYLPIAGRDVIRINEALVDYPGKAKRLFQEIEKKVKMLKETPYLWPEYQINPKYRRMILDDHLLFYIVDENERKIKVYRILYSKMDIPKYIE